MNSDRSDESAKNIHSMDRPDDLGRIPNRPIYFLKQLCYNGIELSDMWEGGMLDAVSCLVFAMDRRVL